MGKLEDALASALAEGRCRIGQVLITARDQGSFELRHRHDANRTDLERFDRADDARALATSDDAGNFRPLKSAPTLRRGWSLVLADLSALRRALDLFYPAAIGAWLAWREARLRVTSLRQTVTRQTGMYRVTGKITTAQADELAGENCPSRAACLRTILWKIEEGGFAPASLPREKFAFDFDQTGEGEPVIPILCAEICNLLVAAAREKVKAPAAFRLGASKGSKCGIVATSGTGDNPAMIYRARHVLPVIGPPIENGAVVVKGDTIAAVGPWDGIRPAWAGEAEDLGEVILMPGLVNAHCHLDYSGLRGAILRPESFAGWIQRINAVKRNLSEDDFLAAIEKGLAECLNTGTTTLLNIESFPALLPRLRRPALRTWWFFEMIDLRQPPPAEEIVSAALKFFAQRPEWRGGVGLSPHAPYTASIELYLLTRAIARRHDLPVTTHVGESYEEHVMFADGAGPLFSFLQSIGRPMSDCGNGRSPLRVLADASAIGPETIIAHLNELPAEDEDLLRPGGYLHAVSVVHCPLSHRYFSHRPFPLERLRKLGINICLGTDSLASNQTLSIFEEMRAARESFPFLRPAELVEMATTNGARALGLSGRLGVLRAGAFADLIALRDGADSDLAASVVEHRGNVNWAMVGGAPVRFGAA